MLSMAYGGVPVVKDNEGRTPLSSACPGKYSSGFGEGSETRKADPKVALDDRTRHVQGRAADHHRDTAEAGGIAVRRDAGEISTSPSSVRSRS